MYGENTITIAIPIYTCTVLPYCVIAYEGGGRGGRDRYKDQIIVSVSLHSKIHPLFMKYSNGTST